jgi:hypothetical protein
MPQIKMIDPNFFGKDGVNKGKGLSKITPWAVDRIVLRLPFNDQHHCSSKMAAMMINKYECLPQSIGV